MQVINFAEQNTVLNQYLAELRDKKYQQNRLLFRNNIIRIGEMMAYELSKTLTYKAKTVTTPLATTEVMVPKDEISSLPPCSAPDCRSMRASSMCSTMPTTPLSRPTVCTPTANIQRWECIPNTWRRPA